MNKLSSSPQDGLTARRVRQNLSRFLPQSEVASRYQAETNGMIPPPQCPLLPTDPRKVIGHLTVRTSPSGFAAEGVVVAENTNTYLLLMEAPVSVFRNYLGLLSVKQPSSAHSLVSGNPVRSRIPSSCLSAPTVCCWLPQSSDGTPPGVEWGPDVPW